jgi:hypothetical protein
VENDLANIKNDEWAGLYRSELSNTMWEYLEWSPTAGFAVGRETCSSGPRAWVNYGSVAFADDILRLSPERHSESSNTLTLEAKDFRTVKWGQQHWLVPIDQLALFAWAVKSRSGAEYELFYIKSEDRDKPRRGLPDLPPEYKRMLTGRPIRATVVGIGKPEDKWYAPMTINAGRKQGVIEGMYFWLLGGKGAFMQVYVTGVGERTATVKVLVIGSSGVDGREITPKPGLQLINWMPANYN